MTVFSFLFYQKPKKYLSKETLLKSSYFLFQSVYNDLKILCLDLGETLCNRNFLQCSLPLVEVTKVDMIWYSTISKIEMKKSTENVDVSLKIVHPPRITEQIIACEYHSLLCFHILPNLTHSPNGQFSDIA